MERRKDTQVKGTMIPRDYLKLVEDVFNKSFTKDLIAQSAPAVKTKGGPKASKECFVAFGEIFPDELVVAICLKNPGNLRMTTCYASVDYPPAQFKSETTGKTTATTSDMVQAALNFCVDIAAGFFSTFFNDGRPLDYDNEYQQDWNKVEIDKKTFVYVKINHDNLELESEANKLLREAGHDPDDPEFSKTPKKKSYH